MPACSCRRKSEVAFFHSDRVTASEADLGVEWHARTRTYLDMFSRLDTLIVRVRDLRAAREWYENALGLAATYVDEAEGLAVLGLEGTSLTLWQLKTDDGAGAIGGGTFPIFAVADAAAARSKLQSQGVDAEALQTGTGVRYFGFRDLDGNRLEACELTG